MSSKVVLLLGAGPRVGLSTIKRFSALGYKVAAVSRSTKPEIKAAAALTLNVDFADASNPAAIGDIFTQVTDQLGVPSVVIYNASAFNAHPAGDPLSISPATFTSSLHVNTSSLYTAAHYAVQSFARLPPNSSPLPTFIYTGNVLNHVIKAPFLGLAAGKRASTAIISYASHEYAGKYRFFYADERTASGAPVVNDVNGDAHADVFAELAGGKEWGWEVHFVAGKGPVEFGGSTGGWGDA